jgi:hypothetical protein
MWCRGRVTFGSKWSCLPARGWGPLLQRGSITWRIEWDAPEWIHGDGWGLEYRCYPGGPRSVLSWFGTHWSTLIWITLIFYVLMVEFATHLLRSGTETTGSKWIFGFTHIRTEIVPRDLFNREWEHFFLFFKKNWPEIQHSSYFCQFKEQFVLDSSDVEYHYTKSESFILLMFF